MRNIVLSPITKKPANFLLQIEVSEIMKKYKEELLIEVENYFKNVEVVEIYECQETKYRFYYPFNIFGDNVFYEKLQNKNNYYPKWKWENELSMPFIGINSFVLDVGCGEGNFLKALRAKKRCNLYGIDMSVDKINYCDMDKITISNLNLEEFSKKNKSKFDIITCYQVLEHVVDVNRFVVNSLLCLKENGRLIIAVPNNNPYLYKHDVLHTLNLPPHHSGLWNKISLKKLGSWNKMKLIELKTQPVGEQISYYTNVQREYLRKRFRFFKFIFKYNVFNKIFSKLLYLLRRKIPGHTILAIYQKTKAN